MISDISFPTVGPFTLLVFFEPSNEDSILSVPYSISSYSFELRAPIRLGAGVMCLAGLPK